MKVAMNHGNCYLFIEHPKQGTPRQVQILTISNHGRSWTLRNVRMVWPRSEAGFFGPGDGAGARRRQRKALVDVLRTGWGEFERLPEGYPCPWDLELEFLGPLDRLEAHEG